jgi:hypothetical protein
MYSTYGTLVRRYDDSCHRYNGTEIVNAVGQSDTVRLGAVNQV